MQVCWRNGSLTRAFALNSLGGASRFVCQRRTYASGFNPIGWVRDKVSLQIKEKQTKDEIEEAKKQAAKEGTRSVFDVATQSRPDGSKIENLERRGKARTNIGSPDKPVKTKEHKYSTANFKISHRKLNLLANQISGKPIDWAILQMQFSEKRVSTRIMNMLATAKDHACRYKRMKRAKLIVSEAWVTKGPHQPYQVEPRGRNHYGFRRHPNSKMSVVLREGKTAEEQKAERREKILKRIVSAGVNREDVPLRNPSPTWGW